MHSLSRQVSSFHKLRGVDSDSAQLFDLAASLTGTLQLDSDEENNLAEASGFTTREASSASMLGGASHWVEGAPKGSHGRPKGAHLRLTLPAGATKVRNNLLKLLVMIVAVFTVQVLCIPCSLVDPCSRM